MGGSTPSSIGAYSSSYTSRSVPSRPATSRSWGAAKSVFSSTIRAPHLAAANVASMNPRWLRTRIATPSPGPSPRSRQAFATAFERASSSL